MHKLTHPRNGSILFLQRPREVAAFVNAQPRVLPQAPPPVSRSLLRLVLAYLAALVLVVLIAAAFFLFGEERPGSVVRPALTNAQRAKAFRLPHGN